MKLNVKLPESTTSEEPSVTADQTEQSGSLAMEPESVPNAMTSLQAEDEAPSTIAIPPSRTRSLIWDFKARGEPFLWCLGGALVIGIIMIVGFVVLIVYNGILTFYPRPIEVVTLKGGNKVAGEATRSEYSGLGQNCWQL